VINQKTKDDYKRQYEFFFKDISLLNRVEIVTNALDQSCDEVQKLFTLPLKCLFVGRGSPEKRVHLFEKLATECLQQNLPLSFTAVGNLQNYLSPAHSKVLTALGEISNASDIQNIYKEHQVLITTSSYEGFPLTIMESMCNGLINVSTAVGGIPEHIIDHQNGILIGALNEKEIKNQLMESLKELLNDMDLCYSISGNSVKYARDNFSFEVFKQKYVQSIINKV
jgi:L-malate glycosyltransferase